MDEESKVAPEEQIEEPLATEKVVEAPVEEAPAESGVATGEDAAPEPEAQPEAEPAPEAVSEAEPEAAPGSEAEATTAPAAPAKKNNKKLIIGGAAAAVVVIAAILAAVLVIIPSGHVSKGQDALAAGDYQTAATEFAAAGSYGDAEDLLYQTAVQAAEAGEYQLAYDLMAPFAEAGNTEASNYMTYCSAMMQAEAGDPLGASETILGLLGVIPCAQDGYIQARATYAQQLTDAGDYEGAVAELDGLAYGYSANVDSYYYNAYVGWGDYFLQMAMDDPSTHIKDAGYDVTTVLNEADPTGGLAQYTDTVSNAGWELLALSKYTQANRYGDASDMVQNAAYTVVFMGAQRDMNTGVLYNAQWVLSLLPDDFSWNGKSVAEQKEFLNGYSDYIELCSYAYKTSNGTASNSNYDSVGEWYGSVVYLCPINDDGTVDIAAIVMFDYFPYDYLSTTSKFSDYQIIATNAQTTSFNKNCGKYSLQVSPSGTTLRYSNGSSKANYSMTNKTAIGYDSMDEFLSYCQSELVNPSEVVEGQGNMPDADAMPTIDEVDASLQGTWGNTGGSMTFDNGSVTITGDSGSSTGTYEIDMDSLNISMHFEVTDGNVDAAVPFSYDNGTLTIYTNNGDALSRM